MPTLKTPADLGNVILQRRKALGWDQARLAHEAGVSRQWIIEIEKGKPRAELQLVLRTLNVLGMELDASTRGREACPPPAANAGQALDLPDVDRIVEDSRASWGAPFDTLLKLPPALAKLAEQQKMLGVLARSPSIPTIDLLRGIGTKPSEATEKSSKARQEEK